VHYLRSKAEKQEIKDWADFSLFSAMRGMEDEVFVFLFSSQYGSTVDVRKLS